MRKLFTLLVLTFGLALFSLLWWAEKPTHQRLFLAAFCLGLALLTKIQAVLLVPPVMVWMLWNWRWKGILPLLVWGGAGLLVFYRERERRSQGTA